MTLYGGGNFNGTHGIGGRCMRDRQNHDDRCVVRRTLSREYDHARAIFATFFPSRFMLVMPQIRIGYDEARLGRGYRHPPALFRFKHGIEMRMPLVHA